MPLIWKSTDIPEDVTTKIISFHFEELKFETIFRNNFILETWRPLTGTNVELDFVHHVSAPSAFLFSEAKVPNFWKDKGQTFSETETLSWNLYSFWSYIFFWWTFKRVSQFLRLRKGDSPGNNGVLLRAYLHGTSLSHATKSCRVNRPL